MYKIEMVKQYCENSGNDCWVASINDVVFNINIGVSDYCSLFDEYYYRYEFIQALTNEAFESLLVEANIKQSHLRYLTFLINSEMELLRITGEL